MKLNYMSVIIIIVIVVTTTWIQATQSTCSGPSKDTDGDRKRGVVLLSYSESEERVHMSLLSSIRGRHRNRRNRRNILDSDGGDQKNPNNPSEKAIVNAMSTAAKVHIARNPKRYKITGATTQFVTSRAQFNGTRSEKCVACRLNCRALNVFKRCSEKYYYYGCRKKEPCYKAETANATVIQTAIGICIEKNSCKLKRLNTTTTTPSASLKVVMQVVEQSPNSPEDI